MASLRRGAREKVTGEREREGGHDVDRGEVEDTAGEGTNDTHDLSRTYGLFRRLLST